MESENPSHGQRAEDKKENSFILGNISSSLSRAFALARNAAVRRANETHNFDDTDASHVAAAEPTETDFSVTRVSINADPALRTAREQYVISNELAHGIVNCYRAVINEHVAQFRRLDHSEVKSAPPPKLPRVSEASPPSVSGVRARSSTRFRPVERRRARHVPRAQLRIVKAPIDIKKLPEDRKKHPGYISAAFDVSDDDDDEVDDELRQVDGTLKRRPIYESSSLSGKRPAARKQLPKFSFSDPVDSAVDISLGSGDTGGVKSSEAPGTESHSKSSALPALSSSKESASGAGESKVLERPLFSFGGASLAGTEAAQPKDKPAENTGDKPGFGAEGQHAKPAFSFGALSSQPSASLAAGAAGGKSAFSFGGSTPNGLASHSAAAATVPDQDRSKPAGKPAFSFGAPPSSNQPQTQGSLLSFSGAAKPQEGLVGASVTPGVPESSRETPQKMPAFSFGGTGLTGSSTLLSTSQAADNVAGNSISKTAGTIAGAPAGTPAGKPALGFGSTSAPGEKVAAQTISTPEASTPALTLGTSTSEKPAFSFGAPSANTGVNAAAKPAFGDASQPSGTTGKRSAEGNSATEEKSDKPAFSFGAPSQTLPGASNNKAASFSFGASAPISVASDKPAATKSDQPAPGFGVPPGPGGSTGQPSFSFGAASGSQAAQAPAFSFGASSGNAVSANTAGNSAASAPQSNAFGSVPSTASVTDLSRPAASTDSRQGSAAPSFGGASAAGVPFTFGTSNAATPAFTFGANAGSVAATKFTFGSGAPTPSTTPGPVAAPNAGATQPAPTATGFRFGTPTETAPNSGSATPQPAFAFGTSTQQPSTFGTSATAPFGGSAPAAGAFGAPMSRTNSSAFGFNQAAPTAPSVASGSGFGFGAPAPVAAAGTSGAVAPFQASREGTPGATGISGRKIAQARKRLNRR